VFERFPVAGQAAVAVADLGLKFGLTGLVVRRGFGSASQDLTPVLDVLVVEQPGEPAVEAGHNGVLLDVHGLRVRVASAPAVEVRRSPCADPLTCGLQILKRRPPGGGIRHHEPGGASMLRRGIVAALASWSLASLAVPVLAQPGSAPVVTPNRQVTKDVTPGRIHTEPQMLVHPDDPNVLVIAAPESNTSTCHAYVSRDRGRTWARTGAAIVPPGYKSCVRPNFGAFFAARFGVDGTLYIAGTAAATPTNAGPNDPFVARSRDLGRTWQYTVVKRSEERDFPKPDGTTARDFERFGYVRLATHPTDPKRVYVGFRRQGAFLPVAQVSERTVVAVSNDGGATFGPLVDVLESTFPLSEIKGSDQPGLAVAPGGTIYAFTKERPPLGSSGPTQGQLPTPPPPANTCRPASSAPGAPQWIPTPVPPSPRGRVSPAPGRAFSCRSPPTAARRGRPL
jgi:hypothetical protein